MIHKDLEVWKKSMELTVKIYQVTENYPTTERYGLVQQMRRACISVVSYIAEGSARKNTAELRQFLFISLGSLVELETQLIISQRLQFIEDRTIIEASISEIRKMLQGIIKKLNLK